MDKDQKNLIIKNLAKLAECTKDHNLLAIYLISKGLLSQPTWQRLERANRDDFSLTHGIFMECIKTPGYDSLIEALDESDNKSAAAILKTIYANATDNKEQNQQSSSDFTISENALIKIVDKFKMENLWRTEQWTEVQKLILSPSAFDAITKENTFAIRVLKDLQEWKKFRNDTATFNKLHEIVNGINSEAAGILLTAKNDIRNS